jgi:hypothetical protein
MTDVKMKALDTFHASNVQADNLVEGDTFTANEAEAKQLEQRGLAKRIGSAKAESEAPASKAEKAAPENKIISAAPADKGAQPITKPATATRRKR